MTPAIIVAAYLAEAEGDALKALAALAADAAQLERERAAHSPGLSRGMLRLPPLAPVPIVSHRVILDPL